mmetsp:Transcript_30678/g.93774  ORF Transcript_30678/g.93774 Transcript_30678/m.93774 type:complete len:274 (-) Transcript_30678:142-963(-)
MCQKPALKAKPSAAHQALTCVVCVAAATLHCRVFLGALRCLVVGDDSGDDDKIAPLERAVLLAYAWDCLALAAGIVPFSRAKSPSDVLGHHVPVFAFLAIGLPYTLRWRLEPAVAVAQAVPRTIHLFERINGWGFLSSLNETAMCLQQAEIHLKQLLSSRARDVLTRRQSDLNGYVFTSTPVQLVELTFKLLVFTVFPALSVKACLEFDLLFWRSSSSVLDLARSPLFVRTLAWRAFVLIQYPSMATRTATKLRRFVARAVFGQDVASSPKSS